MSNNKHQFSVLCNMARNMKSSVFSHSHTHLITYSPQGKNYTLLFPLHLNKSVDYAGAAVRHPQTLLSWLLTRWQEATCQNHNFQLLLRPLGSNYTADRTGNPKRAWTCARTRSHENVKTERPRVPPCHNMATRSIQRASQALGCTAFSKTGALTVVLDLWLKRTPTTLIRIGDRSCFALGVSSCRQVS